MPSPVDLENPPSIVPSQRRSRRNDEKPPVRDKKILFNLRRSTFVGSFLDVPIETDTEVQAVDNAPPVHLFRMFAFASKLDIILMTIGLVGAIITGLTTPLNTLIYGDVLNGMVKEITLIQGNMTMRYTKQPDTYDGLLAYGRAFAVDSCLLGFSVLVATYLSIVVFNIAAQNQILRIRNVYLQSVLNKDIAWFDVNQTGEFSSRMNDDLTKLSDGLGEKIPMLVHFLVGFLSSMMMALYQGWKMTLMCMPTMPIGFVIIGIAAFFSARLSKREMEAYARAGAIAEEVFAAIRTVVAFGGEKKETARYAVHLALARTLNIKKAFFNAIGFGCLWLFVYCTYAWSFWYGVELVLDVDEPGYTPGTMFTVFMSILMGGVSLVSTAPFVESLTSAKSAAAKVFAVIAEPVHIDPLSDTGVRPERCNGVLEFCDVFFDYPNRPEVRILQGLTVTIRKGQTVALVGSSGCGKSTCLQLIQRFYDPDGGKILLDGHDLRELNVNWLRSSIGVVGQEPVLFGTTVYENIRYGRESATQQDIENAARAANAHNFIVNLPHGYETMVGERGAQMSGGQKQRIAIARALVRNPEILLLDEATSALDTASEAMVQDALDAASQGRTTVIVAHRLSTVRNADMIVVLHQGCVVEQGNHKELMALGGYYHGLVTVQMGDVDEDERKMSVSMWMHPNPDHEDKRPIDVLPGEDDADDDQSPVTMSAWQLIKWNAPEKAYVVIGALCSLIQGSAMPVFAVIYGGIIETLSNPDASTVREETTINCVQLVFAGLVVGCATFMQVWTFGIAGEYLTERLRKRTFVAIMRQEMAWHDDKEHGTGTLCSLLSGEAAAVQGATGQRIGTVLGSVTTTALGIGIGMYYSWQLGFVALVFTPLILIAMHMEIRLSAQSNMGNQKALKRSTKIAVEVVSNIRTVASLGRERMFHQQYMTVLGPSAARGKRLTHVRGLVFGVARSSLFFANAACIMFGAQLVADGKIELSKVFVATQALIMGSVVIASTLAYAPNFQRGIMAASTINQLLLREPLVRDPHASHPDRYDQEALGPWNPEGKVSFEGTEFFYPSRPSSRVLQGLYLTVKPGQSVAFVGSSGCGKSTCMQLLLRFYDPTAGFVAIDNRHIETVSLATLRAQIGIVSQEPSLFDRTIADNIAYGDNARRISRADVMDAAKLANIHNFIETLPLSYDTRLGSRGTQLSGGQKQRIAIARALVRRPKVLLLDEATSALDMESEKVVQAALDAASEGRTSITIAHRLSTIVNSDVIFVMHEGQVVERGTHAELLVKKGMYYRLFTLQSGAVRLKGLGR